jgi:hypothetical protein
VSIDLVKEVCVFNMKLLWYDSQNRACFIGLVERLGSEITIEEGNGERRKRVKKRQEGYDYHISHAISPSSLDTTRLL